MKVNFSNIEVKDNELVPQGSYLVHVTNGEIATNDNTGNEYFNWEFTIDEGQPQANRKLWDNMYLTEKSLWRVKQFCAATNKFSDDELDSDDFDVEVDDMLGAQMLVTVKHNTSSTNGRTYANISQFKAASDGEGSLLP